MPTTLEIHGLVKRFGPQGAALGPLDLTLEEGRMAAIIGRSGCGKSTLLRLLAGLETPSDGSIRFAGRPVAPDDVAVVFQEPRLMPWLSVAANIGFGLHHLDRVRRDSAVAEALEQVGLSPAAHLLPKQLSGGMAQRVALARALAVRPRLLLLDEPFSALDPLTRTQMQDHLLGLWHHYGPTIVLVTHDMEEALALADRIVVLDGPPGRMAAEFAPGMPHPRRRSGAAFQHWRDRLTQALEPQSADVQEMRHAV